MTPWGAFISSASKNDCFDNTGKIYLDTYLEIKDFSGQEIQNLKTMEIRLRFSGACSLVLFHVPKKFTRKELEFFLNNEDQDSLLNRLKNSEVSVSNITRKKEGLNSLDFIKW